MSNDLLSVVDANRIYHNCARQRIESYLRRFGVAPRLLDCIQSGGTEFFFDLPITKRFSGIWQTRTISQLVDEFSEWRHVSQERRDEILNTVDLFMPHMRDIERTLVYLGYKVNRRLIDDRHHYCHFDDIACFIRYRVSGWADIEGRVND